MQRDEATPGPGSADRAADKLRWRLAATVARLRGDSEVGCDSEVFYAMLALYEVEPQRVFDEVIAPWMLIHEDRLALMYDEHKVLPGDTPILDDLEALLVLERFDRDRAGLVARWPHAPAELAALADAWGSRLFT